MYAVLTSPFSAQEREDLLLQVRRVRYHAAPAWLGPFQLACFALQDPPDPWAPRYVRESSHAPPWLRGAAQCLGAFDTSVKWNTVFVQRYPVGAYVLPHRDPKDNRTMTIIQPLGPYTGAETRIEDVRVTVTPEQILALRCNMHGAPRPLHAVSAVESGERFAIIINQIEQEG